MARSGNTSSAKPRASPSAPPYPEVVKQVKALVDRVVAKRGSCTLVVDSSGVGVPVVDMMQATGMGCRLHPISITSGEHATDTTVPAVHLITKMQMMAQSSELKITRGCRNGEDLHKELLHLQVEGKSSRGGEEQDDLALALSLACWVAKPR